MSLETIFFLGIVKLSHTDVLKLILVKKKPVSEFKDKIQNWKITPEMEMEIEITFLL